MATGVEVTVTGYSSKWMRDCENLLLALNRSGLVAGRDYDLIDGGARNSPVFPCLVVESGNRRGLPKTNRRGIGRIMDYLHSKEVASAGVVV